MTRKEVLAAAKSCVCGDRDKAYGKPGMRRRDRRR